MARKCEKITANMTNSIHVHLCHDGYYIYVDSIGYNVAMRAKTERDAFMEALESMERAINLYKLRAEQSQCKIDAVLDALGAEEIDEERDTWCAYYR